MKKQQRKKLPSQMLQNVATLLLRKRHEAGLKRFLVLARKRLNLRFVPSGNRRQDILRLAEICQEWRKKVCGE